MCDWGVCTLCVRLTNYNSVGVFRSAKLANAHDFILAFPDGYDTVVGERGVRLGRGVSRVSCVTRILHVCMTRPWLVTAA